MNGHSTTYCHAKGAESPHAVKLSTPDLGTWVQLEIPVFSVRHIAWQGGQVVADIVYRDRPHVTVHLSVDAARVLHASLAAAIAKAEAATLEAAA
jgi:hypothetical protein